MGGTTSAEFNKSLSDAIRSSKEQVEFSGILAMAEKFAAELNDKKSESAPEQTANSVLQDFRDPDTNLNLLQFVCFGDYHFDANSQRFDRRAQLIKDILNRKGLVQDINAVEPVWGKNALHCLLDPPNPHPGNVITNTNRITDIAAALLAEGIDFDAKDKRGRTPIMYAAINMYLGAMTELVGRGASVSVLDQDGFNVFRHFVVSYGLRAVHEQIKQDAFMPVLAALTAVATNADKNVAFQNHRIFNQYRNFATIRTEIFLPKYQQVEADFHQVGRVVRVITMDDKEFWAPLRSAPSEAAPRYDELETSFDMTVVHLAIMKFAAEVANETIAKLNLAIVKFLVKNGFGFYLPDSNGGRALWNVLNDFPGIQGKRGKSTDRMAFKILCLYDLSASMSLDDELRKKFDAGLLCRLHPFDTQFDQEDRILPTVRRIRRGPETMLDVADYFVSGLFLDRGELQLYGKSNPIVASILLGHFGLFSYLLEQGGFKLLLSPITPIQHTAGNYVDKRDLTPMHILLGVSCHNPTIEGLHQIVVDRCIQFAFELAEKENYFQTHPALDFESIVAVDCTGEKKLSLLDVRSDLKDALVTPHSDNEKVDAYAELRRTTIKYLLSQNCNPKLLQESTNFRNSVDSIVVSVGKLNEQAKNQGFGDYENGVAPTLMVKKYFSLVNKLNAGGTVVEFDFENHGKFLFPNVKKITIECDKYHEVDPADFKFLASRDSPAFTSITFDSRTKLHLLFELTTSSKLAASLETVVFINYDKFVHDLGRFGETNFKHDGVQIVCQGGGGATKSKCEEAQKERDANAKTNGKKVSFIYTESE